MMKCFSNQRYYRLNKLYMSSLGIWPEQTLFYRCLIPFFFSTTLISIIIPELIRIRDVWGNVDKVIEGIPPLLVMIVSFIKVFNSSINIGKMRKVIHRISHDWEYLNDPESAEVLHNYAARGRLITVVYSIYIYGSMSLYLILPVMPGILDILIPLNETRPRKPLYEAEYGVDADDYFFEILIHSYVTTIVTISVLVSVDSMYFINVQHACALFKVVGVNLKMSLEEKHFKGEHGFGTIRHCINLHKDALSFADLLESTYSTAFAGIIFIYLLTMSISGVLTLIKIGQPDDMLRFASFTLAQAFSLYLNSVPGQNLIDHSLHIHSVFYEFPWYEMPAKVQRLIILMMLRSIRPCVLTAGKVYLISMESYSSVMKSAMSYFTVLSSMR
nr:olfactory receptor 48 [Gregopimpla kuwanae]